jgi:hypothetical protein
MGKYIYNNIKDEIKKSGKLIYWLNEKGEIILTDTSKNNSKNKILKMKKNNGLLYRFTLTFHTGKKSGQGGPLAINIVLFNKDGDELSKVSGNKHGIIWFSQDYLERMGWKENYINITYDIVSRKNFEFKIRIYLFDKL